MKLDILVFAAHPDDAELGCGGTIAKHVNMGFKVGIVDLTRGELSTRGTTHSRAKEADMAAGILGVAVRENLNLRDGFFNNDEVSRLAVIRTIRCYRPDIILANAVSDRHPDHPRGAGLVVDACFQAGLSKIETSYNKKTQSAWRPDVLYHYIQSQPIRPDLIVDISAYWEKKKSAIEAFASQFYNPDSEEPETYISSGLFLRMVKARAEDMGHTIGAQYGEGFTVRRTIGVDTLTHIR